ncbi:hypothetical protein UA08_01870 [Talaromyces atroroseus]|uniref:FAD-binding FR-type domain-containing protein n=1 Tax=Talaromyces atroroseus TaxID=1441469 RepID=A0A1Q5QA41_TALAT|nr:hypothetical protein UA08_01870 [Talaromyces atroroseus]OKL62813.1 hypothetical protein UA08_01870 [Talaromyces atroroseus]
MVDRLSVLKAMDIDIAAVLDMDMDVAVVAAIAIASDVLDMMDAVIVRQRQTNFNMDMGMGSTASSGPLTAAGVDFSNETQAVDFLQEILDDSVLGVVGNQYARYFWYGIVVVIGIATISNLVEKVILQTRWDFLSFPRLVASLTDAGHVSIYHRIRASSANRARPAQPTNALTQSVATATAILRELSYLQITPVRASSWVKVPPFGSLFVCAAYFAFLIALVFTNDDVPGAQHYQALGIRAGWLGAAQMPLLVLLSSRTNLIGLLCNLSYERLNVYHRWVSRGLLLLATFHFAFQGHAWDIYGLMALEWNTDECPPTGMAAYAILLWMNLTTVAPLRYLSYKFFVVQHVLTYFGFTIALAYHLYGTSSPYSTNYIYISVALYLVGQLVRIAWGAVNNFSPSKCTLTALDGGATKIRVSNRHIKNWNPGSYARVYIPRFDMVWAHPATLLSTPTSHDGDLVFLFRSYRGFTRKIHAAAAAESQKSHRTLIGGPCPSSQLDLGCFDTLVLIAGSTGVTFTLSNLLDLAHRAQQRKPLPLRVLHFTWVIKKKSWISWVAEELQSAFEALAEAGIETHFNIYITCDDSIAGDSISSSSKVGCQCNDGCKCCQQSPNDPAIEITEKKVSTSKNELGIAPYAAILTGRPTFHHFLAGAICQAQGETAVAVCGPLGLSVSVRSAVVWASDELAVNQNELELRDLPAVLDVHDESASSASDADEQEENAGLLEGNSGSRPKKPMKRRTRDKTPKRGPPSRLTIETGQNGHSDGDMNSRLEMRRKDPSIEAPSSAQHATRVMGRESFTLDDDPPAVPSTPMLQNTSFFALPEQDRKNFLLLVLLYFLQGIPMGLAMGSVPFLLKPYLSYGQIGVFSLASYPYSLKLLWSPIVDAVWSRRFGRRKSWITPVQLCSGLAMIYLSSQVESMMKTAGDSDSTVWAFTRWWFFLVFLCATQDIAVDGWALTLLSPQNISYASTAQTVGLTAGHFLSYTVFLALNSPEFANRWFRTEATVDPARGLISLGGYIAFAGWAYIIVTIGLFLFKKEERTKDKDGIMEVYRSMWSVLKLRNIQMIIVLHLIAKIGFQANDAVTSLKLIDKGFGQDNMALVVLIDFPFEIALGYYAGQWSTEYTPMRLWSWAFVGRLAAALFAQFTVMIYPAGADVPTWYILITIAEHVLSTFMNTVMFVAISAFHARISDPAIGGTYMTLLATVSNLGGTFPKFFILKMVDMFTSATCIPPTTPPDASQLTGDLVTSAFSCALEADKGRCQAGGGQCVVEHDGYYITNLLCVLIGAVTFYVYIRPTALKLQALPLRAWRVTTGYGNSDVDFSMLAQSCADLETAFLEAGDKE